MTIDNIVKYRINSQQLAGTKFKSVKDMVAHFGAVQSQDYAMGKWAIGLRLSTIEKVVEKAIDDGEIIRTHILRPTWHFVSKDDIHWMLKLSGPKVKEFITPMLKKITLDEKLLKKSAGVIIKLLEHGDHLTREEIIKHLGTKGIKANNLQAIHIMMHAELDGIIYNGKRRGKQFTYSLMPQKRVSLSKEEMLAELAKRYFFSHGPAAVQDFYWWSGMSMVESKSGLELIKSLLNKETIDGKEYWFSDSVNSRSKTNIIHLLPAYDEFMVGYKDRSATLDADTKKKNITAFQLLSPIVVEQGKLLGTWKRTFKRDTTTIEFQSLKKITSLQKQNIAKAAERFGKFMGMKIEWK